jgi:thiol-disulfide isomerase/thioredoxin
MRLHLIFCVMVAVCGVAGAQERAIVAQPRVDPAMARFDGVLRQALGALARAGSYSVDVDSVWGAADDQNGPQGGSRSRLIWSQGKYRIEMQSQASTAVDLIAVNDGAQATTYYPARKLYSQHAVSTPQASLAANKMLAMSLQGSALDIILQPDVAQYVQTQASGLVDGGEKVLDGKRVHHFELTWSGARVALQFAAEGEPLLLQFTRTTIVPTAMDQTYQVVCKAKFNWRLGETQNANSFAVALPPDARRVNEIYEALAGDEEAGVINQPLPKLTLAKLDGENFPVAAAADKKATVFIFWASWCAASVDNMPAVGQFVAAFKDRGIAFYAVNVGESPGEVRRFTAKQPLVSSIVLDPRGSLSSALRINELPAVAIVGPDNKIRAILHGSAKELQTELASQLQALLAGGTGSTARRPGEAGRAK